MVKRSPALIALPLFSGVHCVNGIGALCVRQRALSLPPAAHHSGDKISQPTPMTPPHPPAVSKLHLELDSLLSFSMAEGLNLIFSWRLKS